MIYAVPFLLSLFFFACKVKPPINVVAIYKQLQIYEQYPLPQLLHADSYEPSFSIP